MDEGVINGRYAWKINLPMLITYESASDNIRQPVSVTMIVTRVSTLDTPKGIAIAQFYASEGQPAPRP
jgi:intracellular multiplication protein IcmL